MARVSNRYLTEGDQRRNQEAVFTWLMEVMQNPTRRTAVGSICETVVDEANSDIVYIPKADFINCINQNNILFGCLDDDEKGALVTAFNPQNEDKEAVSNFVARLTRKDRKEMENAYRTQKSMLDLLNEKGFIPYDYHMLDSELEAILSPYIDKANNGYVLKVPVFSLLCDGDAGTNDNLKHILTETKERYLDQSNLSTITVIIPIINAAHIYYLKCTIQKTEGTVSAVAYKRVDSYPPSFNLREQKAEAERIDTLLQNTTRLAFGDSVPCTFQETYKRTQDPTDPSSCGLFTLRDCLQTYFGNSGQIIVEGEEEEKDADISAILHSTGNNQTDLADLRRSVIQKLHKIKNKTDENLLLKEQNGFVCRADLSEDNSELLSNVIARDEHKKDIEKMRFVDKTLEIKEGYFLGLLARLQNIAVQQSLDVQLTETEKEALDEAKAYLEEANAMLKVFMALTEKDIAKQILQNIETISDILLKVRNQQATALRKHITTATHDSNFSATKLIADIKRFDNEKPAARRQKEEEAKREADEEARKQKEANEEQAKGKTNADAKQQQPEDLAAVRRQEEAKRIANDALINDRKTMIEKLETYRESYKKNSWTYAWNNFIYSLLRLCSACRHTPSQDEENAHGDDRVLFINLVIAKLNEKDPEQLRSYVDMLKSQASFLSGKKPNKEEGQNEFALLKHLRSRKPSQVKQSENTLATTLENIDKETSLTINV